MHCLWKVRTLVYAAPSDYRTSERDCGFIKSEAAENTTENTTERGNDKLRTETTKEISIAVKLAYGGLLTALGILLPQAFHIFGQDAGMIFLPIQLPVFLAGLLLGPVYGGIVGFLVPVLSSVLTAMPPVPKVYFMLFELITYGVVTGLLRKKCPVYLNLAAAMLSGRALYGISLVAGVKLLGIHAPFANWAAFISGIVMGIPGIVLQLILLPFLYKRLLRINIREGKDRS